MKTYEALNKMPPLERDCSISQAVMGELALDYLVGAIKKYEEYGNPAPLLDAFFHEVVQDIRYGEGLDQHD